ncbi:Acg family FMN-binding oxidoreductase [Amycolatopsis sp. PS_44_ISF1]|uniref:Acg family FMN-binding oxidoreductase n=1 Tax=Amycolatopsis sp. PS_44_ISF1 TaxID=2974917 RepID=UPI0028DE3606|nr:nitroreductase [Amycolatopsis sp. PS_44_ISF1]MDT8913663.1 nitroreductase [Amycolatopsis sp. PS_44_ISF1]
MIKQVVNAPEYRPGGWTVAEAEVLARSVLRAPSVHNTQPWLVEPLEGTVLLRERLDVALPHHDPDRRDLAISCGTALAHLELAVRVLGRRAVVTVLPDPARPGVVARIDTPVSLPPSDEDLHRYGAIMVRRSHRGRFTGLPVRAAQLRRVTQAAATDGVRVRRLHGTDDLAPLLERAARTVQHHGGYQRELALWMIRDHSAHRHGVGIGFPALPPGQLPWAGLVRRATVLPELRVLRKRLRAETVLVFSTAGDTRLDHIRAGYALEHAWLEAVTIGLSGAVLTQPMHVPEVRAALSENFRIGGYPQVLLRLGRTIGGAPPSLRRGLAEVLITRGGCRDARDGDHRL